MPRSAYIVASVMMKGGRPICTTPKAWKTPMRTPTASEIVTAPAIVEARPGWSCSNRATTIETKPATAPTERSMPPVMMTKVSPIARMAIIAPCRSRLAMLLAVQKVVVSTDSASHIASSSAEQRQPQQHIELRRRRGAGLRDALFAHAAGHPHLPAQTPIASVRIVSCEASLNPCDAATVPPRKTCSVSASS